MPPLTNGLELRAPILDATTGLTITPRVSAGQLLVMGWMHSVSRLQAELDVIAYMRYRGLI